MREIVCFKILKLFLLLILASLLDNASDDGVGAWQSIGKEEILMVKQAILGNVQEESGEAAVLGVAGVDHGADVGQLDEELMRLTHFIEFFQDT